MRILCMFGITMVSHREHDPEKSNVRYHIYVVCSFRITKHVLCCGTCGIICILGNLSNTENVVQVISEIHVKIHSVR